LVKDLGPGPLEYDCGSSSGRYLLSQNKVSLSPIDVMDCLHQTAAVVVVDRYPLSARTFVISV
ncbi:hypothetical protein BGW38_008200, partial [Lunasporangiospora selenospora]